MGALEQIVRVNLIWSVTLIGVFAAIHALRVRNPRTRYNVLWTAYSLVLPATIVSLFYRPQIVVPMPAGVTARDAVARIAPSIGAAEIAGIALVALIAVGAVRFALRWLSLLAVTRKLSPCEDPRVGVVIEQLKSDLGIRTGVRCYESDDMSSPWSMGFIRPLIVIARGIVARTTHPSLHHIMAHELTHIRHHDYARNYGQKLIRSLFFFNPIAHYFDGVLDEWREVACDRDVIAAGVDRRAYAETLLEMGIRLREQWAGSPSVALLRHRSNLMRRVSHMRVTNTTDNAIKVVILASLVAIAFVIIACSNTEEVAGPVTPANVADADQLVDVAALHGHDEDGKSVIFGEEGNKFVWEFIYTGEPPEDAAELHEALSDHLENGTELSKEQQFRIQEIGLVKHTMREAPVDLNFSTNENGDKHAIFFDEKGNKALIELKEGAGWTPENIEALHELPKKEDKE